jgi:3-methyladenine DNA glycosylase AlkD
MSEAIQIIDELKSFSNKNKARILASFFKTGKGEYGEGDHFLGITVPIQRSIAKKYAKIASKKTIIDLLNSPLHECRLTGVFMLCQQFNDQKKNGNEKEYVNLYLKNINRINNWDLVDSSAHIIIGQWLEDKDRNILYKFANSKSLWKNRIAIIATLHFIKKNDIVDILKLSKIMLTHQHDLIHKATGWMLREAWKRKPTEIEKFISLYATSMPRTMLRYAIEKMDIKKRSVFLQLKPISKTSIK